MSEAEQKTEAATASKRGGGIKWIVGALLLLFAAAAVMNLPRGYSDDLSRIGKGQAAVVLIRDKNALDSYELQHVMDDIRDQYAGRVEFLMTDHDTPEGREFMAANNAEPVRLVLFDASGNPVKILHAPLTAGNLQQEIADVIGIKP